ncbi:hypothetical protein [Microbispora triticiradicis]|uniref:hypothetical protein n=1 Tax=Microbispora triticiradicis TaxID=2200763 RepID=UPI001AD7A557|nr:hypothetical protein [Microbispora triticiradicis]MBO4274131.1 hypothetical protein [Microbispora triticiradicis]
MPDNNDVTPTPEKAAEQRDDTSWPRPGDEGYVHPDGTPQAAKQLEDNRRAAADRAAAGSTVHGAPLATPGPQADQERAKAVERAENYDGKTVAESEDELTGWIDEKTAEAAEETTGDTSTTTTRRQAKGKS